MSPNSFDAARAARLFATWMVLIALVACGGGGGEDGGAGQAKAPDNAKGGADTGGSASEPEAGTTTEPAGATGDGKSEPVSKGDPASKNPAQDNDPAAAPSDNDADTPGDAEPGSEEEEGIADSLFPKMKDREARPIPAGFGADIPVWQEARKAAEAMANIDPTSFDDVYGTVNGVDITFGEILDEVVTRFGEKFVDEYRHDLILLAEIDGADVEVTADDMRIGEEEFWGELRKQGVANEEQLARKFKWTPELLRRKVFLNEGGKKVFASDMEVDDPDGQDRFFMQVWMTEMVGRYAVKTKFGPGADELAQGVVSRVGDCDITALDVAPFLIPNLKQFHYDMAFESLAEKVAMQQEIAKQGVVVTEAEIADRIEAERRKYAGSLFNYETMLQLDETTLPMEHRKFRAWLAYNKLHGEPTDEELREHYDKNTVYFGRGAVAGCEIKTLALDPDTGELKSEDAWEKALDRIREVENELNNGVPFQQLVMRFSEEPKTKKYESATLFGGKKKRVAGSIGIYPIKEGRMSDEISVASFVCQKDDWIGPIKGRDGYHIISLIDAKAPRNLPFDEEAFTDLNENGQWDQGEPFVDVNRSGNWNAGQRGNALDDFQTERVGRWIQDVVAKAEIVRRGE